jgi:hypothetical protein
VLKKLCKPGTNIKKNVACSNGQSLQSQKEIKSFNNSCSDKRLISEDFLGQKVNPIGFRVGVIRGWESNWYEAKSYSTKLQEDEKLRKYVRNRLKKPVFPE